MVQTGTPTSVMTDTRNDLRANLSGQDPSGKNRATSNWVFCSVDEITEKFSLPVIDITLVDCPIYGNIDRDVAAVHDMKLQFLVRAEKSSHRNTLRDIIPNILTLTNCSHHYTWQTMVDGREDLKKFNKPGERAVGPRFYTSRLVANVTFNRNWS